MNPESDQNVIVQNVIVALGYTCFEDTVDGLKTLFPEAILERRWAELRRYFETRPAQFALPLLIDAQDELDRLESSPIRKFELLHAGLLAQQDHIITRLEKGCTPQEEARYARLQPGIESLVLLVERAYCTLDPLATFAWRVSPAPRPTRERTSGAYRNGGIH